MSDTASERGAVAGAGATAPGAAPRQEALTVRVDVLGPLRTEIGGTVVDAGGPRQRAVLARLVAAGGHVVPTDRFIDDLWQGEPPPKALAALQVYVSNLRRALEPGRVPRTPATVVVSVAPGYALRLPDEQVDAWRFEALLRRGSEVADADPRTADTLLRAALQTWAGPAYAEFADEPWAAPEAARLEELRLVCVETAGRAALRLGRAALVVPELDRHVQEHPLREEAVHLLATALYRAGRQADALAALRHARRRLSDELGVDPGPALRALEADVLAHAPHLSTDVPFADSAPDGGTNSVTVGGPPATSGVFQAHDPDARGSADEVRGGAELREPGGTRGGETIGAAGGGGAAENGAAFPAVEAVGRDAELDGLNAVAGAVEHGGLRIVWIGGEAGAGKTTLLRAFAAAITRRGWRVAWGRCPEVDGAPPAWAWTEVLRDLAAGDGGDERLRPLLDGRGGEPYLDGGAGGSHVDRRNGGPQLDGLGRDLGGEPYVDGRGGWPLDGRGREPQGDGRGGGRRLGGRGREPQGDGRDGGSEVARHSGAPPLAGRGGGDQFQLAQAVGERLGAGGPLLVVLDDVHRADGETLQVLRHVAVALAERSVMVVATFRAGEAHPQLGSARAALAGPRSSDVALSGLGPDAAAKVLAGHLGGPLDAATAAVVHERTGGNPLFLAETARLISAEGAGSAVRAIPSGIGHVLRRRLARLPAAAQTVLRHAAILGRDVDIDVLTEAFAQDEDAVLDALEAGVLAGLLEEPAPGRVRFGHALLRDVLYDDMPQLRRRRLHERVLAVLERTSPGDVAALGHHALAAVTPATADRAAGHAAAAARQATALFAHREAAVLYSGALDALALQRPLIGPPRRSVMGEAALRSGAPMPHDATATASGQARGGHAESWAVDDPRLRAATAMQYLSNATSLAPVDAATRLELLCGLVSARANSGDAVGARAARNEAAAVAHALPGAEPIARALGAFDAPVAWTIRVTRYADEQLVQLMEETLARPGVPAALRCRILVALVYELEGTDLRRCDEASAEALRIADDEGDPLLLCQALNARYFAVLNPERRHELPSVGERLLEVAERAGSLGFQAQAHHVLYQVALERSDLRLAQEHLDRALERSTAGQLGVTLLVMAMLGAIGALFAGDYDEAERLYTDLGERIEAAGQPNASLVGLGGVFFVRLAQGRSHTMLPALESVRAFAPDDVDELIVRALVDGERMDEARARWRPEAPIREDYYWLGWMGVRAGNAAAIGDAAVAARCYEDLLPWAGQFAGLASGSVTGPPVDELLGRLATALGRPADEHFAAARELAARTGATPWM
ncbi:BTAD domain-containing putative transcriptional regulator [Dactylosporangium sp. CA-139066]|uniref:BTAD domain-containing putative transcriptional regulator n=1 Tax=Dactylosporangium sp. CA-139066 TaxID=3239930 RepID=UPI003D94522E